MNFSNSLKHVLHYRRHAKSFGTIDSSLVSHNNIANFFRLVISICPSWHFSPRLDGLSWEPVELFRNKSARGGSELPANVSPEAMIIDHECLRKLNLWNNYQHPEHSTIVQAYPGNQEYCVLGSPISLKFFALCRVKVSCTWPPGLTKAPWGPSFDIENMCCWSPNCFPHRLLNRKIKRVSFNVEYTCTPGPDIAQESWAPSWVFEQQSPPPRFFPSRRPQEAVWQPPTLYILGWVFSNPFPHWFYHERSTGLSGRKSTAVILAIPNLDSSVFTLSAKQIGS